ncbi:MAG: MBOAT family O-acyltransferase [Filifactoraceae bacterium]
MIFSSYEFVFLFLPIVFCGYFCIGKFGGKVQRGFLTGCSLFFYGFFNPSYLWIIISSIVINYWLAKLITAGRGKGYDKPFLLLGIVFNLGMLGYFKYMDFFVENINKLIGTSIPMFNIFLPLGISFFTFQQFSFLISIFKGEERVGGFIEYCLFVTFFPQLVAGPIVLYSEMMPQFSNDKASSIDLENVARGLFIFALGMVKKIVIADSLCIFVDNGFDMISNPGMAIAWVTSIAYTFQIYFDFSGYCDMAMGLGKMFNINLPINFNSPYKSKSITEFWRRWHMTLGRALSNYVYIPLGGNRKGRLSTYVNLIITFFVSGLWHGAAWNFVFWGLLHGMFSVMDRIFKGVFEKIPNFIKITGTFLIVNGLWVLFRAKNMAEAMKIYKGMINIENLGLYQFKDLARDGVIINMGNEFSFCYIACILFICFIIVFCLKNNQEKFQYFKLNIGTAFVIALIFVVCIVHMSRISPFIYFNF